MTDHDTLAAALVAALADLSVVEKNRTAKIETKTGPSYSYEYADLGDVVKLTRPALAEHGLVVLTPIEEHGNGLKCTIVLLHSSGERMDFGPFPFPHGQTAQATGSMVTYYRRYALVAALGMAAGDDDDGAQAAARTEQAQPQAAGPPVELGEVAKMQPREVSAALRERGMPLGGTIDELRERLAAVVGKKADETPQAPPGETPSPVSPGALPPAPPSHDEADGATGAEQHLPSAASAPVATISEDVAGRLRLRLNTLPDEQRTAVDAYIKKEWGALERVPATSVTAVGRLIDKAAKEAKTADGLAARAAGHANRESAA